MAIADRHPALLEANQWAAAHAGLLTACYLRFRREGDWPLIERLQHDFELKGEDVDAWALARQIPTALGFVERERLVLRVRALGHVPQARPLLEDWCAVLRLAYHRWCSDPSERLTRADVLRLVDDDVARTRAVSALLFRESWAFGSGHGGLDDDWSRELTSGVRAVRDARVPEDLLAARNEIEFPSVDASAPVERASRTGIAERIWRRISDNQLLAALAAGILLAGGGAAIKLLTGAGGASNSPSVGQTGTRRPSGDRTAPGNSGKSFREQAGTGGARTFADPRALSGEGVGVRPGQFVRVSCKLYSPSPPSVMPDGYWYRLASAPWNDRYSAPANSFWNGDEPGHLPYTHNTDYAVPSC